MTTRSLLALLLALALASVPLFGGTAFAAVKAPAAHPTADPAPYPTTHPVPHRAAHARARPVRPAAPRPAPTGMVEDERTAVSAVDGFWRRHFQDYFNRSYTSPRVFGGYVGTNGPTCGGARSQPGNAFYCKPGNFLAWDENLMSAGYQQIGDGWVYVIIAHEWGHAIQAQVNRHLVAVENELQADCLAGAALQGAQQDGALRTEPGDNQEISKALVAVADKYPWTSSRDHGNAQQRVSAYNKGNRGGVPACFATG